MEQLDNKTRIILKSAILFLWVVIFIAGVVVSYYNDAQDPIMLFGINLHNALILGVPLYTCIAVYVLHKIKSNRKGNN